MKKTAVFILALFISAATFAQGWMQYLPSDKRIDNTLTFYDYQNAFNRWCKELKIDHTGYYYKDGEKHKAYGWKQFKRWEHSMRGAYDLKTGVFSKRDLKAAMDEYYQKYPQNSRSLEGDWVNLGYAIPEGGYYGVGRLNCVEFHPTDPDEFWVGSPSGGLWHTSDHGATWVPLTDNLDHTGISAIAVPPDYETSQVIYIGTGDRGHWSSRGIGILKSTDGGSTWQTTGLTTNLINFYVGGIAIDPIDHDILFSITSSGFYKSEDGGANWDLLKNCKGIDMEFNPANMDIIYISTREDNSGNTRVFRTADGGQSWSEVLSCTGVRTELAVSPDEPTWVYALVADSAGGLEGIFRSSDSGENFSMIYDGHLPNHNILNTQCSASEAGGQGGYDLAIAVNPQNAEEVFVGGVNTWKSTDGGLSWDIKSVWSGTCSGACQEVHADHHWFEFQYDSDTLFDCNDGGIYFTHDGGDYWEDISSGLVINQIYRISCSQQIYNEIIMGLQDNSSVLWTGGDYWEWGDGDGTECLINPLNNDLQFHCSYSGRPVYTTDHWSSAEVFEEVEDSCGWFKVFRLYPNTTSKILWGQRNLWISYDNGANFDLYADLPDDCDILEFQIATTNPDVVFVSNYDNFYKTEDGGESLITLTDSIPYDPELIFRMEIKNDDENIIWITNDAWDDGIGVMQSVDGGLTWTDISDGLPDIPVYDIIQNDLVTEYVELYASTFQGVWLKLGDDDWMPFSNGLPNIPIEDIDLYYAGTESVLRAGTWGRGFWESPVYSTNTESPGIWTGNVSANWFDIDNWLYHSVPGTTTNVTIPGGCPNYPELHSFAQCKKLKIERNARLTVSQSMLQVNDSLILFGRLVFNGNNADLAVYGNVVLKYSAIFEIDDPNLEIHVYGNWNAYVGNAMQYGTVIFKGDQNSYMLISSTFFKFHNLTIDKEPGNKVIFTEYSNYDLIINGTLNIASGEFQQHSDKATIIYDDFINNDSYKFYEGDFVYSGDTTSLNSNPGSFFNDFVLFAEDCYFNLLDDIEIKGDVELMLGTLAPGNHSIALHGNFNDNNGIGQFDKGTGRVIFTGGNQQTSEIEDFNILELNKSADSLVIANNISCDHFDWTAGCLKVSGGSFTANDLLDNGISGNYTLTSGSIDLYNDNYVDLNGFITITGGNFNVHGGAWASYWPYSTVGGLTMSGGTLDFKDQSIFLHDFGTFTDNITGGVIRTAGGFSGERHDFNPAGGYIELYGTSECLLGHGTGSSFYETKINKSASDALGPLLEENIKTSVSRSKSTILKIPGSPVLKPSYRPPQKITGRVKNDGTIYPNGSRSAKVNVNSYVDIDNDLIIENGELDISDQIVDIQGMAEIHGTLTMTDPAGAMHFRGDVQWWSEATENVTAGNMYFLQDWSFGASANHHFSGTNTVTANGTGVQEIDYYGNDAAFRNLVIAKPSSYLAISSLPDDTLTIAGDLVIEDGSFMKIQNATRLVVDSTLHVESGGSLSMENNAICIAEHQLKLDGNLILDNNPTVYCHKTFEQGATGHLTIHGGSFIIDAPYTGTLHSFSGTTDLVGGNFEITNNGIQLGTEAVYNFNGGNMRIGWGFKAIYPGTFQPSMGTVELMGNRAASIELDNGNRFHNLLLTKGTYTVFGMDPFTVNNNLTIHSGTLDMMGNELVIGSNLLIEPQGKLDPRDGTVKIAGNWTNNRGSAGFTEGTSTVIFQGIKNSTINNSESFYILKISKPSPVLKSFFFADGTTTQVAGNFEITDGDAHLGNNTTLNISQDLVINSGAGLDAAYGSPVSINIYRYWTDYNTSYDEFNGFNPGTSTVTFLGGEEVLYNSPNGNFYNLTINKSDDAFLAQTDFTVLRDFNFMDGEFDNYYPGLTYEFKRNFSIQGDAIWYDSTSTIKFTGPGQHVYTNLSISSLNFKDVVLNMSSTTDADPYLTLNDDLKCHDDLDVIDGNLMLNGKILECEDRVRILSGGKISALDNSTIKMGDGGEFIIAGGTLELVGTYPGRSTVTRNSTGYYTFTVNSGGMLNAARGIFEYMGTNGIDIASDGTVGTNGQLSTCIFRNGMAGGTLLRIQNGQTLTIRNASFPTNTWSGTYNVTKTSSSGSVTFINESGGFAGTQYENDPNNKVFWSLSGRWTGLVSTNWHTGGNWYYNNVPDTTAVIYIPASAPYQPWVTSNAICKSLTLEESATLRPKGTTLSVRTYADILGNLLLDTLGILTVDSLTFGDASQGTFNYRGRLNVNGNMMINAGADIDINDGYIYFQSPKNGVLTNQADTAFFFQFFNSKPAGYTLTYSSASTGIMVIRDMVTLSNGSRFIIDSPEEILLLGRFRNLGGSIHANDGTFILKGDPYYAFRTGDKSYFNHLTINTTARLKLDNNQNDSLVVNGVLKIETNPLGSSGLEARSNIALPAMPIIMRGNWINQVGTGGFVHGNGRVEFLRTSGDQEISGHTNFYDLTDSTQSNFRLKFYDYNSVMHNLTIKHRVAVLDTVMVYGTLDLNRSLAYLYLEDNGYLETEILDQGGHFVANSGFFMNYELVDNDINGDYQLNGGSISLTQDPAKSADLNASITVNSGEFWISGGSGVSKWPSNTGSTSLTMTGGIFGVYNGIQLNNNNFTENISGGTIKTAGNFTIYDEVSTFHPIGGKVELIGNNNSTVSMFPAGCWFHDLEISKGTPYQVAAEDYVNIRGELRVTSGTFRTNGQTVQVGE